MEFPRAINMPLTRDKVSDLRCIRYARARVSLARLHIQQLKCDSPSPPDPNPNQIQGWLELDSTPSPPMVIME